MAISSSIGTKIGGGGETSKSGGGGSIKKSEIKKSTTVKSSDSKKNSKPTPGRDRVNFSREAAGSPRTGSTPDFGAWSRIKQSDASELKAKPNLDPKHSDPFAGAEDARKRAAAESDRKALETMKATARADAEATAANELDGPASRTPYMPPAPVATTPAPAPAPAPAPTSAPPTPAPRAARPAPNPLYVVPAHMRMG